MLPETLASEPVYPGFLMTAAPLPDLFTLASDVHFVVALCEHQPPAWPSPAENQVGKSTVPGQSATNAPLLLWWPLSPDAAVDMARARLLAHTIAAWVRSGHVVLTHVEATANRATVVAALALAELAGTDLAPAVRLVRAALDATTVSCPTDPASARAPSLRAVPSEYHAPIQLRGGVRRVRLEWLLATFAPAFGASWGEDFAELQSDPVESIVIAELGDVLAADGRFARPVRVDLHRRLVLDGMRRIAALRSAEHADVDLTAAEPLWSKEIEALIELVQPAPATTLDQLRQLLRSLPLGVHWAESAPLLTRHGILEGHYRLSPAHADDLADALTARAHLLDVEIAVTTCPVVSTTGRPRPTLREAPFDRP